MGGGNHSHENESGLRRAISKNNGGKVISGTLYRAYDYVSKTQKRYLMAPRAVKEYRHLEENTGTAKYCRVGIMCSTHSSLDKGPSVSLFVLSRLFR